MSGSSARSGTAGRERGMTMLELLLVMTLVALVLGVGVGAFASLDLGKRAALGVVQNTLRAARNTAVAREAPARVRLVRGGPEDVFEARLLVEGERVVGTWHFEALPLEGAFGLDGEHQGGALVEDGFQGKALSFQGETAGARVLFAVHRDPAFDLTDGFAVECALRPARAVPATVLSIGTVVRLETARDGALRAWFVTSGTNEMTGAAVEGGQVIVETPPGVLAVGRWNRVVLRYDRRRFTLEVDGVEAAATAETAPVWKVEAPLVLAGATLPFPGAIDSLAVAAVDRGEPVDLPPGVRFAADAPETIVFDAGGRLDPAVHRQPVRVVLELDDGTTETVGVSLYGTVE